VNRGELMEKPVLTDKDQFPTEEIIFSQIGKTKDFWVSLFNEIKMKYPEFTENWRYYNDGKSWLLKVTKRKKTIFWISVFSNLFKTAFYFGDKAEPIIMASDLSSQLKEQYKSGKKFGKIRAIVITPVSIDDVNDVMSLVKLKLNIK
jgi:Protein of unknown function (DUF3788)